MVRKGDRISIDTFKVGQQRRCGVVSQVSEGISGIRLSVRWDDGHETTFSPAGGNLRVEPKNGSAKAASSAPKTAASRTATAKAKVKKR